MADVNDNQESKEDADKKKKNPLEGKSREELIQLVKKYLNLLQKSKNKSDELSKKCSVLEEEKGSLVQKYETSIKELEDEIRNLKPKASKLKEEKIVFDESDQGIESLKQQLRETTEEKNKLVLSHRENEEQLQCRSQQMQSIKASCQLYQEENLKLQKLNKEQLEEISSLNEQNEKLSTELLRKKEEYDLLLNVKEDIEKKYEESVDKNHTLQANIEKLNNGTVNSDKEMETILLNLQKYQKENKDLKKELQKYSNKFDQTSQVENRTDNENIPKLKDETLSSSLEENSLLQSELDQCRLKIQELEKEINQKVSPYLSDDCNMGIELALLHGATTEGLVYPVEHSKSKVSLPQSDVCGIYKNINETNKNANYTFERSSNAGLEFALLQGGDLSDLLLPENRLSKDLYSMHAPCDDIAEYAPECEDSVSYYKAVLEKYEFEKKDLIEKLEKYEFEKKGLIEKLEEFSSLYEDTLTEKNLLKEELENAKAAETMNIPETVTESKCVECSIKEKHLSDDEKSNAKGYLINDNEIACEKCKDFRRGVVSFIENIQAKVNFDLELDILENPLVLLKHLENLFTKIILDLDKKNFELNDYNSQLELLIVGLKQGVRQKSAASSYQVEKDFKENINTLQLFLNDLISRSSCVDSKLKILESQSKTEIQALKDQVNQLNELRQFLEEENSALSSEVEKLKCYLGDIENCDTRYFGDSYQIKTELYSIDENTELDEREVVDSNIEAGDGSISVSDMSMQITPIANDFAVQTELNLCSYSDIHTQAIPSTEDSFVQTELDRFSELKDIHVQVIPEVHDFNTQTKLDCHIETKDIFVQIMPLVQDFAVQTESDFYSQQNNIGVQVIASVQDFSNQIDPEDFPTITENKNTQTDCSEETNVVHIEQLTNENEALKKVLNEKSTLVDNIHCQMDSLLTKIEELNEELQNKNDDLKHSQLSIADLKKMLTEAENIKIQQINTINIAQTLIKDLRKKNSDLNGEVQVFNSTYKELITSVNNSILSIIQENCESTSDLKKLCDHKESNLSIIKMWIHDFTNEFVNWFNFLSQITPEFFPDISQLEKSIKDPPDNSSMINKICNKDDCCAIQDNMNELNLCKLKLFSALYNHLDKNYSPAITSLLSYKEEIIPNLEKNLSELETRIAECTCKNNSKSQGEAEDSEKTSEIALKNTLADTETKMNKFKQIAVKLKKELNLTKEQYNEAVSEKEKLLKQNTKLSEELNSSSEEQRKCVQNYQSLQREFDKLQDECEVLKSDVKKLESDLASKLHELNSTKEQVLDLESQLQSSKLSLESSLSIKKDLDIKCTDLESKLIVLESKIVEREQKINSLEMDLTKYSKDLKAASEENKKMKDKLISAQKEGNKKSLLDLEMADYERSIVELNGKIKRKEDEIEELQKEIQSLKEKNDCLLEELRSTETLKETEAKRAESLKDILERTKSDLNEAKEHEADLMSKTASLQIQLETMNQQEEDFKLRLSEASAQIQHLQDVIKTSSDNHQRLTKSFEQKIANQKEEILIAHKEVESVKQEFENYKIRVHSVLKQQKSVTPAITAVDVDLKEKLETINEKLKLQVKDLSDKLNALSLEYDSLQEEHNNLLRRYDKVIEDREQKDKEWHQRLEFLNVEKNRLRATQEELSSQHLLQNEMLVATYKKQIKIMSEEHKKIVSDLQKQLDAADVEIARLQRDQQKLQGLPVTPSPQDSATSFDLLSQERQEGEGSENTDETNTPIKHLSLATIPTTGFLSFEKLIQSPTEPGTPASYISGYESEKLATEINTANRKIHHLNELLNDSESTNMRLSEQVRVLKDEVRRLENNKEREQHSENLEYLKNILVKFSTLQPGSEKAMLIPVLTTMLKLSPNEQQQLKSVAGDMQSDDNMNAGWGSYLHRWSGLS